MKNASRKDLFPVRHHLTVAHIPSSDRGEVVGGLVSARKELAKARQACVNGVTHAVHDHSVWHGKVNEADVNVVGQHLVDHPPSSVPSELLQSLKIVGPDPAVERGRIKPGPSSLCIGYRGARG